MKQRLFDLRSYLDDKRTTINRALDEYLPGEDTYPQNLHKAMRYSVFSGGKRFRPILCITAFEACGGEGTGILPVACTIELIHTYSLIHDDLPCMDDDDLRRGKPTAHKVFGDAIAVLAGDALLTLAVQLTVEEATPLLGPEQVMKVLQDLMRAIGTDGMVAGQVVDMEMQGQRPEERTVEYIHSRKTGALIASSARCGAIVAGAGEETIEKLSQYGHKVGLAFQITDDILDAEGKFGALKSGSGLDRERQKVTYPLVCGLAESRSTAHRLIGEAKDCVAEMGTAALALVSLADLVIKRSS